MPHLSVVQDQDERRRPHPPPQSPPAAAPGGRRPGGRAAAGVSVPALELLEELVDARERAPERLVVKPPVGHALERRRDVVVEVQPAEGRRREGHLVHQVLEVDVGAVASPPVPRSPTPLTHPSTVTFRYSSLSVLPPPPSPPFIFLSFLSSAVSTPFSFVGRNYYKVVDDS